MGEILERDIKSLFGFLVGFLAIAITMSKIYGF